MATTAASSPPDWTVADLLGRFGPMPAHRIRTDPAPGLATEADVVRLHDREARLYELVDGVLVEKAMGYYESYLACVLVRLLGTFVAEQKRGIVAGADGMWKIPGSLVEVSSELSSRFGGFPAEDRPHPALLGPVGRSCDRL